MNWQPIETAPRNRLVILYWPPAGNVLGRNDYTLPEMIRVDRVDGTPFRPPTHWMPLPEPPK